MDLFRDVVLIRLASFIPLLGKGFQEASLILGWEALRPENQVWSSVCDGIFS
jgi:hypothetical protein